MYLRRHVILHAGAAILVGLLSSQCIQSFVPPSPCHRGIHSKVQPHQFSELRRPRRLLAEAQRDRHHAHEHCEQGDSSDDDHTQMSFLQSRRSLLQGMAVTAAMTTMAPLAANAGKAELDRGTGELFSPKSEMIRGGSDAARGIRQQVQPTRIQPGQSVQTVYEPRFIAYLTRFLLTFDPPSHAWWIKQGFQDSWEQELREADRSMEEAKFAEFAEAVEIGLADYFTGPYGSYASVSAAKAGLPAAASAKAARASEDKPFWDVFGSTPKKKKTEDIVIQMSKQGILNLYALLKARYTSVAAIRQMAILFSLISSPKLQPVNEIRSLLGEADNATITKIAFDRPPPVADEARSRTSSLRGGGYSIDAPPIITIDPPPALGDSFPGPVAVPQMKPTSRILRINVVDSGSGYTSPPAVSVKQGGFRRLCEACAILDREGHVESIVVLDPGYGYGLRGKKLPEVIIEQPKTEEKLSPRERKRMSHEFRPAKAVAELEYEIVGIDLLDGGNGYSGSETPSISISPPQENPDWYYSPDELFGGQLAKNPAEPKSVSARVVEMRLGDGTVLTEPIESKPIDDAMINLLERDPLELLPTSVRPMQRYPGSAAFVIPTLPPMPPQMVVPSARYRAYDPLFGGVGSVPVTMGALELSASEYSRIALGGAVCTVIVRTLLNPLELVKTKIQLKNDKELNEYAYALASKNAEKKRNKTSDNGFSGVPSTGSIRRLETPASNGTAAIALKDAETMTLATEEIKEGKNETVQLGTMDVIKSIVALRGPLALFQSADITFLASLVFGSFGFGATELFRRSFTATFMPETGGASSTTSTLVLLAAAAVACVITSAAATPFEVLRVRSMGLVEAKPWKEVFFDYVVSPLLSEECFVCAPYRDSTLHYLLR